MFQAVTLADNNAEFGAKALKEITEEFGVNKAIFVETDVTKWEQFEGKYG